MDSENFPPNSRKAKSPDAEPKKLERVTSGEAVRRKKSMGKQLHDTFIGGDAKSAVRFAFFDVVLPAAKDALVEAGSQGIEKLIFGETRRKPSGARNAISNYVSYGNASRKAMDDRPPNPMLSRRARARNDFDEIVLPSRAEAEEVLQRMFDVLAQYDSTTVADLCELTGVKSNHTDHKWGWTDLRGSRVSRTRQGDFLLDLPEPEPLT